LVRVVSQALEYRHLPRPLRLAIMHRMEAARTFVVADADAGGRLDHVVARELGVSRGFARKLVAEARVPLRGRPAGKGTTLRAGEAVLVLEFARPEEAPQANPDLPLALVAEANGLVALDKPAGQPTHPLAHAERDTALNALIARFPGLAGVGEGGLRS